MHAQVSAEPCKDLNAAQRPRQPPLVQAPWVTVTTRLKSLAARSDSCTIRYGRPLSMPHISMSSLSSCGSKRQAVGPLGMTVLLGRHRQVGTQILSQGQPSARAEFRDAFLVDEGHRAASRKVRPPVSHKTHGDNPRGEASQTAAGASVETRHWRKVRTAQSGVAANGCPP